MSTDKHFLHDTFDVSSSHLGVPLQQPLQDLLFSSPTQSHGECNTSESLSSSSKSRRIAGRNLAIHGWIRKHGPYPKSEHMQELATATGTTVESLRTAFSNFRTCKLSKLSKDEIRRSANNTCRTTSVSATDCDRHSPSLRSVFGTHNLR